MLPSSVRKRASTSFVASLLQSRTNGGGLPGAGTSLTIASTPPVSWKHKLVRRSICGASLWLKNLLTLRSRFWFCLRGFTDLTLKGGMPMSSMVSIRSVQLRNVKKRVKVGLESTCNRCLTIHCTNIATTRGRSSKGSRPSRIK